MAVCGRDQTPFLMNLYRGGSSDPAGRLCVMNVVDRRWKLLHGLPLGSLTDMPECTDPMVARTAQVVNDRLAGSSYRLSEDAAARLLARERRLMSAVRLTAHGRVRLAWMLASKVADSPEAVSALGLLKRWLDGEAVTSDDLRDAAADTSAAYEAPTSVAAEAAAYYGDAAYAAAAANAASQGEDALIDWLDYVLDCHEKVAAEEGQWDEIVARAVEIDTLT